MKAKAKRARAKRTPRGFRIYAEFKDSRGNTIRVQESSAAGRRCVYLFTRNADGFEVMHFPANNTGWHGVPAPEVGAPGYSAVSPHLNPTQCKRLIRALQQHLSEIREVPRKARTR